MTHSPQTTPLPPLVFMPKQSLRSATPTPTTASSDLQEPLVSQACESTAKKHIFAVPKLRLQVRDLNHEGAEQFLSAVIASKALKTAVHTVLSLLYQSADSPTTTIPSTRSVTLVLRPMEGVAYTIGSDLDSDHKEIHLSLDYIKKGISNDRKHLEIIGVLTHEMVHCFQYNAFGTCPGGLIEGVADWVRLKADLGPPHWKKDTGGRWDAGYQRTGYFLEYLENRFGHGTVRRLNEKLRIAKYEEKRFWTELCGRPVTQLWGDYQEHLKEEKKNEKEVDHVLA